MFRHAQSIVTARNGLNGLRRTFYASRAITNASEPSRATSSSSSSTIADQLHRAPTSWKLNQEPSQGKSDSSRSYRPTRRNNPQRAQPRQLRPPVLAGRATTLAQAGHLDDAVHLVKNAPLDAQNVVVWNTLLKHVMDAKKYKLAYTLYIDMKRRGFVPDNSTYTTMLRGYASINENDWSRYSLQLENVHKLYESWKEFAATFKGKSFTPKELNDSPATFYILILGRAGNFQRMFEVYNLLEAEDLHWLSPHFYHSVFRSLQLRKVLPPGVPGDVRLQNASDARVIWRQMLRAFAKHGHEVDSYLIHSVLYLLRYGRPADQLLGFDIFREYVGYSPPGEPAGDPQIPMSSYLLDALLDLCVHAKKYSLAVQYLMRAMETLPYLVEVSHCEHALRALVRNASFGSMNESAQALEIVEFMLREAALNKRPEQVVWPSETMYRLALTTCWLGGDWTTAVRLFELMTRIESDSFLDGRQPAQPSSDRTRAVHLNTVSLLVRTALASGEPVHLRQCLRIVCHFDMTHLLREGAVHFDNERAGAEFNHHRVQYANGIVSLVTRVLEHQKKIEAGEVKGEDTYRILAEEEEAWKALQKKVARLLKEGKSWSSNTFVPSMERSPLGSTKRLAAMDSHVDYAMTERHMRSAKF